MVASRALTQLESLKVKLVHAQVRRPTGNYGTSETHVGGTRAKVNQAHAKTYSFGL